MADDIDYASGLQGMLPKRVYPRDPKSIRSEFSSDTEDLTPAENAKLLDHYAYGTSQPMPPVAFMRAGNVPPVGELSSGPSSNIEDRRGQFGPWQETPTIAQAGEYARSLAPYHDATPPPSLLGSTDLFRHHMNRLMQIAIEPPPPLPRSRPRNR